MNLIKWVILCFCFGCGLSENLEPSDTMFLEPGEPYRFSPNKLRLGFIVNEMRIYCYSGCDKSLGSLFQTVNLRIDIDNDDYTQYEGRTPEIVREHYIDHKSIFSFNILSTKKRLIKLDPFNQTCIGIDTVEPYTVHVDLIRVDFWKVIYIVAGILMFYFSARLSDNALFYYISGVLLGIFASFLVLVYFASKLVPRRPMMYGVLLGGWTIGIYFIQLLWENLQTILVTYRAYVFWYMLITGFTSFVICYRLGPPTNKRSKNLIKWGLQIMSLLLIFFSSDFQEAACALDILVILSYYFPRSWLYRFKLFYLRQFPPKPRLLTDEEYYEQGVRETTKALDELRKYCNSPECKQWRVITKLNNPKRFADFMEGSSHLIDDEILEYETSKADPEDSDISDDEDENPDNNDPEITDDEEERNGGLESSRTIRPTPNTSIKSIYNGRSPDIGWRSDVMPPQSRNRSLLYRSYNREYIDD